MRNRAGRCLVAFLLIFSIGGHWAFLQSVAWVTMVVDYWKDAPISVAVQKTFDGKHPCKLCKLVNRGKQSEQKQNAIKGKFKMDLWVAPREICLTTQMFASQSFVPFENFFPGRGDSPPVPPPRFS